METVGFSPEEIDFLFRTLSAILKLFNLSFLPKANIDGTLGCSVTNDYELHDVCDLLSLEYSQVEAALTSKSIVDYSTASATTGDVITLDASADEVRDPQATL